MDARALSEAQKRSIVLEYRFRIDNRNIGDICEKYELSRSGFQRLRKELGPQFASKEEMVIAGVYEGARTIRDLIAYLDYRDHAGYSEAEVQSFIGNLVGLGVLVDKDGAWFFASKAPASRNMFVFTAPEGAPYEPSHFYAVRRQARRS